MAEHHIVTTVIIGHSAVDSVWEAPLSGCGRSCGHDDNDRSGHIRGRRGHDHRFYRCCGNGCCNCDPAVVLVAVILVAVAVAVMVIWSRSWLWPRSSWVVAILGVAVIELLSCSWLRYVSMMVVGVILAGAVVPS
jgi:hypothetical protein